MLLKTLELQGFKSFPDKTVLRFDRGATVIVGPNGSGKSNISDAMKWVLGELSSKSLRGNRMEDVIFGGTDTRRQMGYAEVCVTFDNSEQAGARLGSEFDEVSITRRYYRAGESEYYINKKPVRLRDIHELFLNTGIGREGYSIIGQGRIAEIISQKSEDRRAVFEEAAGISKYRFQKTEAEKKLLGVEDNLQRVQDILAELTARVGPLEKDAEKAKIYLSLYAEKKQLDVSLWLFDMELLRVRIETLKADFLRAKDDYDRAGEALTDLENRSDRLYQLAQENKAQMEHLAEELTNIQARRLAAQSDIKVQENEIAHIDEQLAANKQGQAQRADFLEQARRELAALHAQAQVLQQQREQAQQALAESSAATDAKDAEIDRTFLQLSHTEEQIAAAAARQAQAYGALAVLEDTKANRTQRKEELQNTTEKLEQDMALLQQRCEKAKEAVQTYKNKTEQSNAQLAARQQEYNACDVQRSQLAAQQNELYLSHTEKKNRVEALTRMEELFEGYARSVRFIMHAYTAGKLPADAVLYGPVSQLITVEQRYATAIETAFGANMQNIVVRDEFAAKAAIRYLKEQNGGRATFYPLQTVRAKPAGNYSAAQNIPGFLGEASAHVQCDPQYRQVIDAMIGRILVADTIESAAKVAKALGYSVRVVTLDGQQVNAGGSFTGGSLRQDSGLLTRTAQIESLRKQAADLLQQIEQVQQQTQTLAEQMQALQTQIDTEQMQLQMLQTLEQAEQTQLQVLQAQIEADREQLAVLSAQRASLDDETAAYHTEHARLQGIADAAQAEQAQAQQTKQSLLQKRQSLAEELATLQRTQNRQQVHAAELQKDADAAALAVSQMEQSIQASEEKCLAAGTEQQTLTQRRQDCLAEIQASRDAIEQQNAAQHDIETQRAEAQAKSLEYEQRQTQQRELIREKTHEKELLLRQYTKAEANHTAAQNEKDKRTGAMWDEYELTLSAALCLEYPPLTEEQRPAAAARLGELKAKIKQLGTVHVGAIEEYAQVKQRYDFLSEQVNDLQTSKADLAEIICRLEEEMRTRFTHSFAQVNAAFRDVFRELFGGGHAELQMTEPENPLGSGIQINVAPPGKIIKNLMLLSGGEQAFVAIALYFALLRVNPAPFCILDEIEAALDEVNVDKFASYLKRHSDRTQYIVITHRRGTMEMADRLYGVTMQEKGISTVLSIDLDQVGKYLK